MRVIRNGLKTVNGLIYELINGEKRMKIVAINSSFRKNGNTEHIIRLIEKWMKKKEESKNINPEFDYISLGEMNLSVCRGCRVCFEKGEAYCPLKDDLADIRKRMADADGIILGSPVYVEDVNGIMKNFIDRLAFYCHRPAFSGKSALIITTSGGASSKRSLRTMKNALSSWGFYLSAQGMFRMGAGMKEADAENAFNGRAEELAGKFYKTIEIKKPYNPGFYSYMVFKIQQKYRLKNRRQDKDPDQEYWEKQGWLDPRCDFYITHKPTPIKSKTARALGGILSSFFGV